MFRIVFVKAFFIYSFAITKFLNAIKMKRTLVLLTAIIICIVSTIAFLHSSKKTEYNILMQNVEALAGGENLTPVHCAGLGCVDCPINAVKVKYVVSGWSFNE